MILIFHDYLYQCEARQDIKKNYLSCTDNIKFQDSNIYILNAI